jgi:hypothetical protein
MSGNVIQQTPPPPPVPGQYDHQARSSPATPEESRATKNRHGLTLNPIGGLEIRE